MSHDELDALSRHLGEVLGLRGLSLATAESCTGGWAAQVVTATAGSSGWFDRGFITYSDAAKRDMLGVAAETLAQHGAVSEATAREMAAGALARSRAQLALAISGVAGPSGGTAEKPVGMVCFAWALPGGSVAAETRRFSGDREAVRRQSVVYSLTRLMQLLAD